MNIEELVERFKNGETLQCYFGIKKNTHSIGNEKITQKQFDLALSQFKKSEIKFELIASGFTRHNYTYIKNTQNDN